MATPLRMPDMGTVEGEMTLVRWLKAEGDIVALGEPLFEVETEKGVSEVESALAGVLERRVIKDGAKVAAGEIIAFIRRPVEQEEEVLPVDPAAPTSITTAPRRAQRSPISARSSITHGITPSIRALAEKHGVDLAAVKGTGPGGHIMRQDVLRTRDDVQKERDTSVVRRVGDSDSSKTVPGDRALPRNQAIVARKVSQSLKEKAIYHVFARVDMTKAIAARDVARQATEGIVPSYDALLVKTAAVAIAEMPVFRQYLRGDNLVEHPGVDVALAVGIENEIFVPAVRDAHEKSLTDITRAIQELVKKGKARTLASQDVEGSCFLVSNLGMFAIDGFEAIVYPEHSAALALGAVTRELVADGERVKVVPMARLTLSVDHRLINGKTAARFLARMKQILEEGDFA